LRRVLDEVMRLRPSKTRYGPLNFSEPALRPRRFRWRMRCLALVTLIGGWDLALLAQADAPLRMTHVGKALLPAPAWIQINRPIELYALEAPEITRLSRSYEAHRHLTGGGRQDILTFGAPNPDSAYVRLVVYRLGEEEAANTPFFVELARRAADGGLAITKSQAPAPLTTRFGEAEVADIAMAAAESTAMPCLGFRVEAKGLAWHMTGFACGGRNPLPRPALQCLFDRLDLLSAGEDTALAKFFADTELRRNAACAGTRMTPALAHAAWLDEKETQPAPKPSKH
jgi:hypothetical protein